MVIDAPIEEVKPFLSDEEKKSQLDNIFKDVLKNKQAINKLGSNITIAKGPFENINSITEIENNVKLTPKGELLVCKEQHYSMDRIVLRSKKTYKLSEDGNEIVDENGNKFSDNYSFLFPGREKTLIENVNRNIQSSINAH